MSMDAEISKRINLNSLSQAEKQALTRKTYSKKSYFQTLFHQDQIELDCAQQAKAFREEIQRLLLKKNIITEKVTLEKLHEHVSEDMKAYGFDDGINQISAHFYETDDAFMQVYYDFLQHLRINYFKEPFWFQSTPTIRIHCPNGKNNHHYPRYHTDIGYGHPPEEINLWLPLTYVLGGHGFRTMSVTDSTEILHDFDYDFSAFISSAIENREFSDYCGTVSEAVGTELGKVLAFDSRCVHSGEPLLAHTRASMDIRILPLSQYAKMEIEYQGAGRRKILFAPGHCYHEKNSDQFFKI
jgi:hypothetical protein